ncbi:MAG: hypothetical protein KC593_18845 [Myxococcales bacterium]|nr:hypothetical protein [Myxococcales bacterium]
MGALTAMELGALAAGLLGLAATVALALRHGERVRAADAEQVAAVTVAFHALAARRHFSIEQPPPLVHPIIGVVHGPPTLEGDVPAGRVQISLGGDSDGHDPLVVVFVLTAPAGRGAWPTFSVPRSNPRTVVGVGEAARVALVALCAQAQRVVVGSGEVVVHMVVPVAMDGSARQGPRAQLSVDVERLEACLDELARLASAL